MNSSLIVLISFVIIMGILLYKETKHSSHQQV